MHRTASAGVLSAQANRRTKIHQALRVGLDTALGKQGIGKLPHRFLDRCRAGEAVDAKTARQNALDVAIENRRAGAEGEDGNGGGG